MMARYGRVVNNAGRKAQRSIITGSCCILTDEDILSEYTRLNVIGCERCADDKQELVLLGMTDDQYSEFSLNHIIMTCPQCGFSGAKWITKLGKAKIEDWIPVYVPSNRPWLNTLRLVRIPETNDRGEFIDGDTYGSFNRG